MTRPFASVALPLIGFVGALILLGGCPFTPTPDGGEQAPAKLIPFESSQELLDYFHKQAARTVQGGSLFELWRGGAAPSAAEEALSDDTGNGAGDQGDFSTTNVQEAGVDESDTFKSDGAYFYIAKGSTLRIVRADPPEELAEVAQLDLDVQVDSLYLHESTIIALGIDYPECDFGGPEILIYPPYHRRAAVAIFQIDISDPAEPTIVGQVELDGALVSSRLTNDRLIVVLTIVPELPGNPSTLTINAMGLDEVLPKMRRAGGAAEDIVSWQNWLYPTSPDGYYMTAVVTLDAGDVEDVIASVAVLANAGTIYASPEALYLTDAEYDPSDDYRLTTAIHKFAFDEDGAAQYVASGSVPGRLLNQFSLGEYEGYLRVATHVESLSGWGWGWGQDGVGIGVAEVGVEDGGSADEPNGSDSTGGEESEPPFNAVYVLDELAADLEVVGSVSGIAPDEEIYAARFMGDHGFLVTFRQIDPLFVLDLSDPEDPQVVGELEIPGYSDYLHPLGETHLLGVGRSVETVSPWDFEEPSALQLSLFDVSDWTNPTLVEQITVGGAHSYSDVSHTHKAFTLVEREGRVLLALPGQLTPDDTTWVEWVSPAFEGVVCFEVDPASGFTELGRVASVEDSEYWEDWWWSSWRRAAFIGDVVYALTADGVRAAPLNDFDDTHEVALTGE